MRIKVLAVHLRRETGVKVGPLKEGGRPLSLPKHIDEALQNEANARHGRNCSSNDLALRLLAIIVKDDLFDALLGDDA